MKNKDINKPKHIGIILDGNGRWALKRKLPRIAGHKEGVFAVERMVKAADKLSAYIKCVEELKAGNTEFREAAAQTRRALEGYGVPEVSYFLDTFMDSFALTLDELK